MLLPEIDAVTAALWAAAERWADIAMLSRTHGQPASPTTVGKEMANFTLRLAAAIDGETAAAWGRMPSNWGAQLKLYEVFKGTGSGVFLALIGSSIVAVQLLLTIARLFRKDPKAAADGGRARKPKDDKSARSEAGASETKAGDASSGRSG